MTTRAACIAALREAAKRLGESPTKAQYEELGLTPSSSTIQRVMGGWNEGKEAADLETIPGRGARVQPKPEDVDLPDGSVWEDLTQDQRWHYKNRAWNIERSLRRRSELRERVRAYKSANGGCEECGTDDAVCLDFHHPPDVDKKMAVNEMVTYGYAIETIEAEMEKCIILCGNCHAKRHGTAYDSEDAETKEDRLRAWTHRYKRQRGCRECGEQDPRSLQFHHPDEKEGGVGALIADSAPVTDVRVAVDRCVVLCVNCHRREHA